MPANRRQHYVPQFYLRAFAGPGGGTIGVWHLQSRRFIPQAKLKGQAAHSWYYGEDGEAERHFGVIEGAAAKPIRTMLQTGRPPTRMGPDHHHLVFFVMLQLARTPAAVAAANRTFDALAKSFLRQQEPTAEVLAGLDRIVISNGNALHQGLRDAFIGAPAIYDLHFKLIDNVSGVPFVTSDNPITLLNSFLRGGENLNVTGTGAAGLQIWLPLAPSKGLLFYDAAAYMVGRPDSRVVRLVSDRHAIAFNRLTWASATTNIYARPDADTEALAAMAATAEADRAPVREWIVETELERTTTSKRVGTEYHREAPELFLELPFIRLRLNRIDLTGVRQAPMRHGGWMQDLMKWGIAVKRGEMDLETWRVLTCAVPRGPHPRRR